MKDKITFEDVITVISLLAPVVVEFAEAMVIKNVKPPLPDEDTLEAEFVKEADE